MYNNEELCSSVRKPHVGMFDRFVNDYIDVVREKIAAETERDAAWDEMDKLAHDYNKLADDLCRTEDQLDEAAGVVRLLIAFARAYSSYMREEAEDLYEPYVASWRALPTWLRKEIEA